MERRMILLSSFRDILCSSDPSDLSINTVEEREIMDPISSM